MALKSANMAEPILPICQIGKTYYRITPLLPANLLFQRPLRGNLKPYLSIIRYTLLRLTPKVLAIFLRCPWQRSTRIELYSCSIYSKVGSSTKLRSSSSAGALAGTQLALTQVALGIAPTLDARSGEPLFAHHSKPLTSKLVIGFFAVDAWCISS